MKLHLHRVPTDGWPEERGTELDFFGQRYSVLMSLMRAWLCETALATEVLLRGSGGCDVVFLGLAPFWSRHYQRLPSAAH